MPMPRKPDPVKHCPVCGKLMERKRYSGGTLEDRTRFLSRKTCSAACGNTRDSVNPKTLHQRARKFRADACEKCGTTEKLHVHHEDRDPSNNDPTNLRTLCASCHLKLHWSEDRDQRIAALTGGRTR